LRNIVLTALLVVSGALFAQFDGAGGEIGSKSIHKDHESINSWATGAEVVLGPVQINDTSSGYPTIGTSASAIGPMDGSVLSLGDGGLVTLSFDQPIRNTAGYDFAVFENGFKVGLSYYLELAHVEVSENGVDFYRFPSESLTDTSFQTNNFSYTEPSNLYNLAGKHQAPYGTLFDLEEVGLESANFVRLIDVVGSVNDSFGSRDSKGRLINEPWPTPFESSGFDLDAVAIVSGSMLKREEQRLTGVRIYPSLARIGETVYIDAPLGTIIQVLDIQGKEVLNSAEGSMALSQAGIYFIRLTNNGKMYTQKVVVR